MCGLRTDDAVTARARFDAVYGMLPTPIVVWEAGQHLAYANSAAEALLGEEIGLLRGRDMASLLQPDRDVSDVTAPAQAPGDGVLQMLRPSGERRWVQVRTVPLLGPRNKRWMLSTLLDQTEGYETAAALKTERGLLQALLDAMPDHIYFKDRQSRIIRANRAQAAYFGVESPDQELGKTDFDFYEHAYAEKLFAGEQEIMATRQPIIGNIEDHSARARRPYWLQSTKVPIIEDGEVIGIVGISRDITELKIIQNRLSHQALHDSLTGLPNRTLLFDRLDQVLRTAQREHATFALALLDLDRFKEVNDTLGHQYGDRILQEVASQSAGRASRLGHRGAAGW